MKECTIEQRLIREIKSLGGMCLKWGSGWVGAPDRIVILPDGVIHFIELKSPTKDLRPLQRKRQQQLTDLNCVCLRLHTIGEVLEYVGRVKNGVYTTQLPK